jgi:hypothetical protein
MTIGNIHDFNKIDLIALRGRARILPGQLPAVREERSGPIPAAEIVTELAETGFEKRPDRGFPFQDPFALVRQSRKDQRCLEDRIVGVQRHQAVEVAADDRLVPAFVDVEDFGIGLVHRRHARRVLTPSLARAGVAMFRRIPKHRVSPYRGTRAEGSSGYR